MKAGLWIAVAVVLTVALAGVGRLYARDAATVAQALLVEDYFRQYCGTHRRYPGYETLAARFPNLYPDAEWYYWPGESGTTGTFQYPMTLPLPSAPGRSKLSEFFPVIYAYAVRDPCRGLVRETPPAPADGHRR